MSLLDRGLRLFALAAILAAPLKAAPELAPVPGDGWKSVDLASTPELFPSEAVRSSDPRIRPLFFAGAPYQGRPTRVFAWLGVPRLSPGENAPGIVLLHGGGGTAFESWVKTWVERGYAAIAIDHFGTLPLPLEGKNRPRNPDGGPVGGSLAFTQLGAPHEDQWPFHAVTAASRALSLLRAEPGVDPDRIGVTGISWGGYLACVFAGVDSRLRFVVPVYGCGHYEDTVFASALARRPAAEAALWRDRWDAANHLPSATAPVLWVNGTNDHFFWLPAWQRSYRRIPSERRTLALHVRMAHGHPPAGDPPEVLAFADSIVRGAPPLPRILRVAREDRRVSVAYSSARPVVRAELSYTAAASGDWEKREWKTVPAELSPGLAQATLPEDAAIYFVNLVDDRGLLASSEHESLSGPR
jgi:dienelactone hydrolase